ncbi:MAG: polyphosphate kinase 2 family protein, partial [Gemmatimonadota bacterium]|nr:polyphosphate kinase 2 family protein [Gemmatimonadota bacterium]
MSHLRPITARRRLDLTDGDARPPRGAPSGSTLDDDLREQVARIAKLQRVFYADARFALLIVLQGRDAAGKDGTIRHVFSAVNPQGCEVASFKQPTDLEQRHDYLWRVHQRVPARGMIGIFNRSHYEDVLVERVRHLAPKAEWEQRYRQINDFERMLTENHVVILKFFLHVSRAEQKRRLRDRLTDETKNWKFSAGDLEDRARWGAYTKAYRDALRRCSTPWAPWYLVPSDDKRVRNWLVAGVIVRALEGLKLRYPKGDPA